MVETNKKQKRSYVSEEDISNLLQKYTATTVLALLQEVAQSSRTKLNWDALVKKTSTGISNAREYQMLWRHLAYRHALVDKLDDGAQPLDDDSDLDSELEPSSSVSSEASAEAAACVKVLIASGLPNDSSLPNNSTVEAPLTINIPDGQSNKAPQNTHNALSMQRTNITGPVSVPKQNPPAVSSVITDVNLLPGGVKAIKKRKTWSESEDKELVDAVRKFGVKNWATISRGGFKGDRTASQLQQRWTTLKKNGIVSLDAEKPSREVSEAVLATRSALSMALDKPNKVAVGTNATALKTPSTEAVISTPIESSCQNQIPSVQGPVPIKPCPLQKPSPAGRTVTAANPRAPVKKIQGRSCPTTTTDAILATAVAAGARIASPKTAASLLKVAQSKNAVHVMTSGSPSVRPSMPGSPRQLESHLKPAVHAITSSTVPSVEPLPARPSTTPNTLNPGSIKSVSSTAGQIQYGSTSHVPSNSLNPGSIKSVLSEHRSPPASSITIQVPKGPEFKGAQQSQSSKIGCSVGYQRQENGACEPRVDHVDRLAKHKIAPVSPGMEPKTVEGTNLKDENKSEVTENQSRQSSNLNGRTDSAPNGKSENPQVPEKKSNAESMANKVSEAGIVASESCGNMNATSESKATNGT